MMKVIFPLLLFMFLSTSPATGKEQFEKDVISTSGGDLEITFIGHGSLILVYGGRIIHVDPYGILADYTELPKADLILLTHHHRDRRQASRLFCQRRFPGEAVF